VKPATAGPLGQMDVPSDRMNDWRWWIAGLYILVCVYTLSFGPLSKLYYKHAVPRKAFELVYAPLRAAGKSCRPVQRFLDWYVVDLWGAYPASPPFLDSPLFRGSP